MDIRVLRYFLAIAREESISKAAEMLHMTQPTLSRQIRELEEELNCVLLLRGNRNVTLTDEGMLLRQRAQEIITLVDRTEQEFTCPNTSITGDVCIGADETQGIQPLARVAVSLRAAHPGIHFHIYSGSASEVMANLDKGLVDFGLVTDPGDNRKYEALHLPGKDRWGLLMPSGHPLAEKETITPEDLKDVPLLASRQLLESGSLTEWLGCDASLLDIAATYNLIFNAARMVEQGLGCALAPDGLVDTCCHGLAFRPLRPAMESGLSLIWKRYQLFSPAAKAFLDALRGMQESEVPGEILTIE